MATNSIGTGQTYTTIQAWEDALPATLTEAEVGECIDQEFTAAGTIVTIDGHTTTASNNITLTVKAGDSFVDHASVLTNALIYDATKGAGIRSTGTYATAIVANDDYITISRFQVSTTQADQSRAMSATGPPKGHIYKQCILQGSHSTGAINVVSDLTTVGKMSSCLILNEKASTTQIAIISPLDVYNCTFAVPTTYAASSNAFKSDYNSPVHKNNLYYGATNVQTGSSTPTFTTGQADDASPPSGVTTKTYANQFESTTGDFRLKTGNDAQNAGTTDAEGSPAINDLTRPSGASYDIGAWEVSEAGGGGTGNLMNRIYLYAGGQMGL